MEFEPYYKEPKLNYSYYYNYDKLPNYEHEPLKAYFIDIHHLNTNPHGYYKYWSIIHIYESYAIVELRYHKKNNNDFDLGSDKYLLYEITRYDIETDQLTSYYRDLSNKYLLPIFKFRRRYLWHILCNFLKKILYKIRYNIMVKEFEEYHPKSIKLYELVNNWMNE